MSRCPFYQVHIHQTAGDELDAPVKLIAWCSYSRTPISFTLAAQTVGNVGKLRCDGDTARCEVPLEHRPPSWLTS